MTNLQPVTITALVDVDDWVTATYDDQDVEQRDAGAYLLRQLQSLRALDRVQVLPPAPVFVEANGLGDTVLWFGQPGDPRPQHVLMQSDLDAYPGLWFWLTRGATVVPS